MKNMVLIGVVVACWLVSLSAEEPQAVPEFSLPSAPHLQEIAKPVPSESLCASWVREVVDCMYAVADRERPKGGSRGLVGLAAPQIGIPIRVILVDMDVGVDPGTWGELRAFINPQIEWMSEEHVEGCEGCFSVDSRVVGCVPRAIRIRISAYDRQGNYCTEELSGMTARIFQHEVDHLDGVRFPDRVEDARGLHWVVREDISQYKKHWQNWPVVLPKASWEAMKSGTAYPLPLPELTLDSNHIQ